MDAINAILTPPAPPVPSVPRLLHATTQPGDFVIYKNRQQHPRILTVANVEPSYIVTDDGERWLRINGYQAGASVWNDARIVPSSVAEAQEVRDAYSKRQLCGLLARVSWTNYSLASLERIAKAVEAEGSPVV